MTLIRFVQPENALPPMLVTGRPLIVPGMVIVLGVSAPLVTVNPVILTAPLLAV